MKIALFAFAALIALPAAAHAQSGAAAGTLPNSFDRPAAARAQASAPAPAAPTAGEGADPARAAAAEAALRTAITALQAGAPDYDAMTPDLATRVRAQAETMVAAVRGFGELHAGMHAGAETGADMFNVLFDKAATQWLIALNDQGKIAVLLFREVQPEVSEAPAAD